MYSDFPESNDTGTPPITLFWVVKTFVAALAAALATYFLLPAPAHPDTPAIVTVKNPFLKGIAQ